MLQILGLHSQLLEGPTLQLWTACQCQDAICSSHRPVRGGQLALSCLYGIPVHLHNLDVRYNKCCTLVVTDCEDPMAPLYCKTGACFF